MLIISHSRGIIKDCLTIGNKIYTIREKFKKRLAKSFVLWYNNMVRRDIEAVITGLTRNRLDELEIRLAESLVFSRFLLFPLVFSLIAFTHFL